MAREHSTPNRISHSPGSANIDQRVFDSSSDPDFHHPTSSFKSDQHPNFRASEQQPSAIPNEQLVSSTTTAAINTSPNIFLDTRFLSIIDPPASIDFESPACIDFNPCLLLSYRSANEHRPSHQHKLPAARAVRDFRYTSAFDREHTTIILGLDSNGQVVMLTAEGSYYNVPSPGTSEPQAVSADIAIPLQGPGQTTTITLPDYISSARVWFADGKLEFNVVDTTYGPGLVEPTAMNPNDPSADVNWGFVELTFKSGYGLFANLSFVDFVGLPLGMQLQTASSGTQSAMGMPGDAAKQVCDLLKAQAADDGEAWDQLCVNDANGNLLRVVSPPTLIAQDASAFGNYFDEYVNTVWQNYASEQLTINTQSDAGQVACSSDGNTISCAGSTGTYSKPSSEDIFGCNTGPFAIAESDNSVHMAVVPRLCAAFNRATLHLPGGNVQPSLPPSDYYTAHPNNWYSAFVHQIEADGKGYAFSYDDVSPNEQDNESGSVYAPDPQVLTVFVGGAS